MQGYGAGKGLTLQEDSSLRQDLACSPFIDHKLWCPDQILSKLKEWFAEPGSIGI